MRRTVSKSFSCRNFLSSNHFGESSNSPNTLFQCRYASDQKTFKTPYNFPERDRILTALNQGEEKVTKLPAGISESLKSKVPRQSPDFMSTEHSRRLRMQAKEGDHSMVPFTQLQANISSRTYEAITVKPFRHTHATPVQNAVLSHLPDLAHPSPDKEGRRDVLAISAKGTGKSLSFLVPAIDGREKAIRFHSSQELSKLGMVTSQSLEEQAARIYTRTAVGTLVLVASREEATTIANESILLSRHHKGMETRLLVGGLSKRIQLRDWVKGRKDVVVSTPGRLRDLLAVEPMLVDSFKHTKMLVIDQADQLLNDGFRDDIDAIIDYLPKNPERQNFIFGDAMTPAVEQLAQRVLNPNFTTIHFAGEEKAEFSETPQFHTILPDASYQIPHLMKLLAHEQLSHSIRSKTIIYLPTTRMAQLFTTLVQELRTSCLPAGDDTKVYSIHSMLSMKERTSSLDNFTKDFTGHSVLVTTDLSVQTLKFPKTTRVIQFGIPSSDPIYMHRIKHAALGSGSNGRGDLVLLPWEIGYLTWKLMHMPIAQLTVSELDTELLERASRRESGSKDTKTETEETVGKTQRIDEAVKQILPQLDEDSIRETFVSLLGYYIPKSGEIRLQRPIIVQGLKDWTTGACGLPHAPYISDAFLVRLGMTDGRTKRFGLNLDGVERRRERADEAGRNYWIGRGSVSKRLEKKSIDRVDPNSLELDPRDPPTLPEAYKTNLYGKPDPTVKGRQRQTQTQSSVDRLKMQGWDT
ncbi:hypothetical protein FRC14_006770 [Serendipita sp. 396]|nr:hypothetical protein FRC14_006770 [Serendipita sp. 396]